VLKTHEAGADDVARRGCVLHFSQIYALRSGYTSKQRFLYVHDLAFMFILTYVVCPEHDNWQLRTGLNPIHCCRTFEEIRRGFMGLGLGTDEERGEEQVLQEVDGNAEEIRLRPAF
jgi:hypothetical protein